MKIGQVNERKRKNVGQCLKMATTPYQRIEVNFNTVDVISEGFRIIFLHKFSLQYIEKAYGDNCSIENMVCEGQVDEHFYHLGQILPL